MKKNPAHRIGVWLGPGCAVVARAFVSADSAHPVLLCLLSVSSF
jgi:hypothetical protein